MRAHADSRRQREAEAERMGHAPYLIFRQKKNPRREAAPSPLIVRMHPPEENGFSFEPLLAQPDVCLRPTHSSNPYLVRESPASPRRGCRFQMPAIVVTSTARRVLRIV